MVAVAEMDGVAASNPGDAPMPGPGPTEAAPSPAEQLALIRELQRDHTVDNTNNWYVLAKRWHETWEKYAGGAVHSHPGPIDLSPILAHNAEGELDLKPHQAENYHFVVVPEAMWQRLSSWFGRIHGQPELLRPAVKIGLLDKKRVEVYKLAVVGAAYSDMAAEKNFEMSKGQSAVELKAVMCNLFDLPNDDTVRIWNHSLREIVEMDECVGEALPYPNQKVVIEQQDSDGTWPKPESPFEYNPSAAAASSASSSRAGSSSRVLGSAATYSSSSSPYGAGSSSSLYAARPVVGVGQTGLNNLGNTCFMNSALQCLSNTRPLTEFFLAGHHRRELNRDNPIGCNGVLAEQYAALLESLWSGHHRSTAPREVKAAVGKFAPRFLGYQQHDSQELLGFMLDGLHEDLNRILKKPYVESKEAGDASLDKAAQEAWEGHKLRNDSVVVDLFHGQLKSTVECPECSKVSITFDPFMYLTVPLPDKQLVRMRVYFQPLDRTKQPSEVTFSVAASARMIAVREALAVTLGLPSAQHVIIKEVFSSYYYKDPLEDDMAVRDVMANDVLAAFEVDPDPELIQLSCLHAKPGSQSSNYYNNYSYTSIVGNPLTIQVPRGCSAARLRREIVAGMRAFVVPAQGAADEAPSEDGDASEDEIEGAYEETMATDVDLMDSQDHAPGIPQDAFDLSFCNTNGTRREQDISPDDLDAPIEALEEGCTILIEWAPQALARLDMDALTKSLGGSERYSRAPAREAIESEAGKTTLANCIEMYMHKERLTEQNAWRCPVCKEERLATKQLTPWKLPEILVVHLKRFSYGRYVRNKITTFVHCPINGLDMSQYAQGEDGGVYDLFAVTNHFGGMGGGHYTAFARNEPTGKWFDFDDSHVSHVSVEDVVTAAAYVLFYRRRAPGAAAPLTSAAMASDGPPPADFLDSDDDAALAEALDAGESEMDVV